MEMSRDLSVGLLRHFPGGSMGPAVAPETAGGSVSFSLTSDLRAIEGIIHPQSRVYRFPLITAEQLHITELHHL
jgi:hypothetical protein